MEHPITPPPELVAQWLKQFYGPATRLGTLAPGEASLHVAAEAARWGADQELEACCAEVSWFTAVGAARRPKPPSLKEQALARLTSLEELAESMGHSPDDTIRRALEQLND